ncbi:transforming growth factor-beta-induced protein ig-h3-like [Mercenaria mercenaria]|uniref:transforming growth factor-beta-induced protein ig-h3-like n=1 Tax=Mercenaria mercenaria TaxID=6596 RepID=UPI00234F7637|nr:transforming growth factor-beta-induced protein ig-h3-like [Mercenaria mercenaria]
MRCIILVCLLGLSFGFEDKTVTEYLFDNSYTVLYGALQSTGLTAALNGSGPFTIFAPTDDAFRGVSLNGLTTNQLASILKYHVVGEFVLVPMISQSTTKTTLDNQDLIIEPSGGGSLLINRLTSNSANVDAGNNDIIVNNGVIQPIDAVLMPPVLPTAAPTTPPPTTPSPAVYNIYQVLIREDTRFLDLSLALLLADLTSVLESSEYTLFAPTDAAFAVYKDNLLSPDSPNAQTIYQEVLKYHVVPGGRRASQLKTGVLYTLHGTPLNVTVGSGVMINNANVIDADIMATNGVIHAIDKLLIPQDINQIAGGTSGKK